MFKIYLESYLTSLLLGYNVPASRMMRAAQSGSLISVVPSLSPGSLMAPASGPWLIPVPSFSAGIALQHQDYDSHFCLLSPRPEHPQGTGQCLIHPSKPKAGPRV